MGSFDDRKKAFEAKFAHDAEMKFRAEARRNRLLAAWAAELLGLSEEQAETYRRELIAADLKEAGDDDVFRKLAADFKEQGIQMPDADIRARMRECLAQAMESLAREAEERE